MNMGTPVVISVKVGFLNVTDFKQYYANLMTLATLHPM